METETMIGLRKSVSGDLAGAGDPGRSDPAVSKKAWRHRFGVD
jgi:hypothetical protein